MPEATQNQGADVKEDEIPVETRSPRDIALEALSDRQEEARAAQVAESLEGDPGAAALHQQVVDQQEANRQQAVADGLLPPARKELEDGALSVEQMHPEKESKPEALPAELQDDPLADFIVMDNGKPKFVMKVNGENMLMPLEDARRQLQIGTAAEVRMSNAAARERQLREREQQLTAQEQALAQRTVVTPSSQPQVPAQADLSEEDVRNEALNVMRTVFSGTEEEAADKLTKVLMKVRTPVTMPTPQIDFDGIVRRASSAAVGALTERERQKDLAEGYSQFQSEYPDIMRDANLYRMADSMTDEISAEHPEWRKSKVMLEAGKRTREWIENLRGTASTDENVDDVVTTEDVTISEQSQPPTQTRQDRKSELVRMPQAAVAAVASDPKPETKQELTPKQALDEVRKARGQAV